jgi:hypothetical protein
VGPAQVVLEYVLPYESLTTYATRAEVTVPALVKFTDTLLGELTWKELKLMVSFHEGGVDPQSGMRQARVCWDSQ